MPKDQLIIRAKHNHDYHPTKDEGTKENHEFVRYACLGLAKDLINVCPEGRELSVALTKLEEVMMWANAAIARN